MRQKKIAAEPRRAAAGPIVMQRESVAVDFPQEGELVTGGEYAIRVSAAPEARQAEVSIDQGSWHPCRQAGGYWWHDWSGFVPGQHHVRARSTGPDGRVQMGNLRWFRVKED